MCGIGRQFNRLEETPRGGTQNRRFNLPEADPMTTLSERIYGPYLTLQKKVHSCGSSEVPVEEALYATTVVVGFALFKGTAKVNFVPIPLEC